MNVKSSAKSKRAHSLHGRRTHNPSPKPSPSTKKQSDQTLTRHDSRLPSNWDRYDDIDFSGAQPEDPNQENVNVGPKSKGADYAYLLSLAKSESLSLLSFDSVIPDLIQGAGPMLSFKGKSLLSWNSYDNFIVDDEEHLNQEASFLSIDLHKLATKLANINLSKRIFIEEDLLPEELCGTERQGSTTLGIEHVKRALGKDGGNVGSSVMFQGNSDLGTKKHSQNHQDLVTSISEDYLENYSQPTFSGIDVAVDHFLRGSELPQEPKPNKTQEEQTPRGVALDGTNSGKNKGFEAAAAEVELDFLLDTFGETRRLDNFSIAEDPKLAIGASTSFSKNPLDSFGAGPSRTTKGYTSLQAPTTVIGAKAGIANPLNNNKDFSPSDMEGSKVLDDFDAWLDSM
ncbi:uncharacterized protein LOC18442285 isoform X1 [Amborella trichopoda]|nr:uncharacterized protein LOC18442285 isoform X1 [Amborella trichopoda]|eukprot:XP_006852570.2 uncharacterized protein LOC18442285 isoform X1 [Amborella trichopoda]